MFKTVPAEDVEEKVIQEILNILRSPEIIMNIEKIAEQESKANGSNEHISKQNLVLALKNLTDVWSYLYPTEQQKVVSMLTDEVTVGDEGIKIAMIYKGSTG